jgi:hypothetical protein
VEGFTDDEIADRLGCPRRTAAHKLDAVRAIWSKGPTP